MLMIRLRPVGKKGQRSFQLIINEKSKDVFGDYLEKLGHYDPNPTPSKLVLKEERIKYWLAKGAKVSDTVNNILVDAGIIQGEKIRKGRVKTEEAKEGNVEGQKTTKEPESKTEAKPKESKETKTTEVKATGKVEGEKPASKEAVKPEIKKVKAEKRNPPKGDPPPAEQKNHSKIK